MAEVNLSINGRNYGVACDDGQEQRVIELGRFVDERLREIGRAGAAGSESHLFVLTALVLADEIFDLRDHLTNHPQTNGTSQGERVSAQEEELIVRAIDSLATRIERIAGRIESA
ncbi:MAG: cell division protein ZapA [Alphaproteobacteria bacterium]|nr:cell division protein ZapA [Alphaproteobacteria bacterium]